MTAADRPTAADDLTTAEQISLTAGLDAWHTVPVERAGIGSLRVTDGPNGARGPNVEGDDTSTCFPVGSALAATWDVDLLADIGTALAFEAREKGAGVLLGPTVNLHRHPLAGRNFECYSEDPHLTARLAVAYVGALQAGGVGACIKHFVANDSEFERHTISSEVDERTLRELYLVPFEAAVREAGTWSVMSAYNRLNGTYASEHAWLLGTVLRGEWGFDGAVISDWGGTMSTVDALTAGLDLEMPGPGRFRRRKLTDAVVDAHGALDEPLAARADNVVRLVARAEEGRGATPDLTPEAVSALARRAAARSMVVLSNDGVLPLAPASSIAVIGPNARRGQIQGGGSSGVRPHHVVTPLDGLTARAARDGGTVRFEEGTRRDRYTRPVPAGQLVTPDGEPGVRVELFAEADRPGEPDHVEVTPSLSQRFFGEVPGVGRSPRLSARLTASFTPDTDGTHTVGLAVAGRASLAIDGREVVAASSHDSHGETFYGFGTPEVRGEVDLQRGKPVELVVTFDRDPKGFVGGLRVGITPPVPADLFDRAAAAAAEADVAVVVVGLDGEWETEGSDRVGMDLPGRQDELVGAVAAANPRTVVVLNAGSPVHVPWADDVGAVVQAWYPGQELGDGLADVLFGDVDASGRLPTTWPRRLADAPSHATYPGTGDQVRYAEGVFMGYRHFDAHDVEPRWPFGHGLSYTTFGYSGLEVRGPAAGSLVPVEVELAVTNTGARAGIEVVQLYVADVEASVPRPPQELKGFARVVLEPGASTTVRFTLRPRDLAFWDAEAATWTVEPGRFEVRVGASSRDIRATACFELTTAASWGAGEEPPS